MKKKIEALASKVLRPLEACLAGKICAGVTAPPPRPILYPCYGVAMLGTDLQR
jgi:hypothetical protein